MRTIRGIAGGVCIGDSIIVGGTELELPTRVYLDPLAREPLFHRAATGESADGVRRSVCRHVVVASRRGNHLPQVVAVRTEHATKIGRPCLSC